MKYVRRTCTELADKDSEQSGERNSRPLQEFQSVPAYVLLGDPGSGKTTAFKVESDELGEEAILVSARDFLALDLEKQSRMARSDTLHRRA